MEWLLERACLEQLGEKIGNARIVALGEGVHGSSEPLRFRNALIRFLVEEKGFTDIAFESGLVEGRLVHDYVRGGAGDLQDILREGLTWTFGDLEENAALIAWLRACNQRRGRRDSVRFYGFDVPGSPGEPRARRDVSTALRTAILYLHAVDVSLARAFDRRLEHLLPQLKFGPWDTGERHDYCDLSAPERLELSHIVADLVSVLTQRAQVFVSATSRNEHEWALRAAVGAQQVDRWLRAIPVQWRPQTKGLALGDPEADCLLTSCEIRDAAMADNVEWILDRGAGGKLLVFAANYHICGSAVRPGWGPQHTRHPMGTYLRQRHGQRLIIIGNLIGDGAYRDGTDIITLAPGRKETFEAWAGARAGAESIIDLREMPWAAREAQLERASFRVSDDCWGCPEEGWPFDILVYMNHVSPAPRVACG